MEVIIGSVGPKKSKDIAVPEEASQCDDEVHSAKDHEVPLGEVVRAGGIESSETAEDVDEVVDSIDREEEEHSIREESSDANNCQDDAEDFGEWLNFSVEDTAGRGRHTEKGESGRKCSTEGRAREGKYPSACKGIMMQQSFFEKRA